MVRRCVRRVVPFGRGATVYLTVPYITRFNKAAERYEEAGKLQPLAFNGYRAIKLMPVERVLTNLLTPRSHNDGAPTEVTRELRATGLS